MMVAEPDGRVEGEGPQYLCEDCQRDLRDKSESSDEEEVESKNTNDG